MLVAGLWKEDGQKLHRGTAGTCEGSTWNDSNREPLLYKKTLIFSPQSILIRVASYSGLGGFGWAEIYDIDGRSLDFQIELMYIHVEYPI